MQTLKAAVAVPPAQLRAGSAAAAAAGKVCQHPTAPARLRRLPESPEDTCVELLVAQDPAGHPCCILPPSPFGQVHARARLVVPPLSPAPPPPCRRHAARRTRAQTLIRPPSCHAALPLWVQARGLAGLIRLEGLDERTLVGSLAAVEGFVANTCGACPSNPAAAGSTGAGAAAAAPSPLAYSPPFLAYLERCLELAAGHLELGPAPAVLLLQVRGACVGGSAPCLLLLCGPARLLRPSTRR